ncbi:MAG: ABC transporter permease [Pseudomonadota bacterium]
MNLGNILLHETGAELTGSLRAPEFIIPTLAMPSGFYLIFGVLMSSGGNAAAYLLATYGVFAVMGPAVFGFGVGVATEREKGWLSLKRVAPAPAITYIGAKLSTTLIFCALAVMPIYLIAGFAGDVAMPRTDWLLLFGSHMLAAVPFSLIGLLLGFSFGSGAAIAVSNIVFLGFALLGGLWLPIMLFPAIMQTAANAIPSFHLAEISLSIVDKDTARSVSTHLAVIAAMTVVLAVLATRAWRRQQ